jgi:hypothetical protein
LLHPGSRPRVLKAGAAAGAVRNLIQALAASVCFDPTWVPLENLDLDRTGDAGQQQHTHGGETYGGKDMLDFMMVLPLIDIYFAEKKILTALPKMEKWRSRSHSGRQEAE